MYLTLIKYDSDLLTRGFLILTRDVSAGLRDALAMIITSHMIIIPKQKKMSIVFFSASLTICIYYQDGR
tara:strand:+ start:446 stop:652 length:207 start_codon:yes stop_codon:yes gene_type:complete